MRNNRIRLSDDEKNVLDATRSAVYDGAVPRGVVVERACRALLAAEDTDDGAEVVL